MDHLRPKYHYLPQRNWMNDPVGLSFTDGWYHMFYQYNPYGDRWGSMHWGHCRSRDLIRWDELPVALNPLADSGEEHCFSGSVVVPEKGEPYLFYTRIPYGKNAVSHRAEQWMARSDRSMISWPGERRKLLFSRDFHNDLGELRDWRDPFVFREQGRWYMLLGGSLDGEGVILLYRSEDLESWEFRSILLRDISREPFLECPSMIRAGKRHLLLYSPANKPVRCLTGTFGRDEVFRSEREDILDNSGMEGFYAPQISRDGDGEIYLMAWVPEESRRDSDVIEGYSGAQTLPRRIKMTDRGYCTIVPHPACLSLRCEEVLLELDAASGEWLDLPDRGHHWELEVEIALETPRFELVLMEDRESGEATRLYLDGKGSRLVLDRSSSTNDPKIKTTELYIPLTMDEDVVGIPFRLRLFADGSLLEIFLNERYTLTGRVYPLSRKATGIRMSAEGRDLKLRSYTCSL